MRKSRLARILVVTQEEGLNDYIEEFFTRRGYETWGTTDLERAGKKFDTGFYKIVILQKEICAANPVFDKKMSSCLGRVIFSTPFSSDQLESAVVVASQKVVSGDGIKDIGNGSKLQAIDRDKGGCYA